MCNRNDVAKSTKEEIAMLKTITQKHRDRSTDVYFKFSFYCDRCEREWTSEEYPFVHGFSESLSDDEKKAKDILFRIDHDAAFERANLEARLRFNQCNSCGRFVCDECFAMEEEDDLCRDCTSRRNSHDEHNKK